jgi:AraC family transcriptional regulator, exoenzyme S synthesis regulatory protein ExsA
MKVDTMINYYQLLKNNPSYFKQFSCRELLFLNYDCPTKEAKAIKWSEHNYIYYVLSGSKTLHTPKRSWPLTKGSAVFVKKGACVIEQFFRDPFCIVVFMMPDSFIQQFMKENVHLTRVSVPENSADDLVIPIQADEVMKAFYESVLPYFSAEAEPPEKLIELKFKELLLHVIRNPDNKELTAYMQRLIQQVTPLEKVMEMNYTYNLPLGAFARLSGRSLSSFKRDFQKTYKTTPGRWLLEKRLGYARQLLVTGHMAVSEVVFESGFESITHFSRAFKQKFGVSPSLYRKQYEGQFLNDSILNF